MKDLFGRAMLDFYHGTNSEDLLTETNISEEDVLPVSYLFRSYSEMPALEQKALNLAGGNVLDLGCGAGSHSLYFQNKGQKVTALDISEGAIKVAQLRGVETVMQKDVLQLTDQKFDTILLLMNGTGIFQKVDLVPDYLQHLKKLLNPDGQILIDSTDLKYMYNATEDGGIWVPGDRYYGELDYLLKYKGEQSEWFPMLYLDPVLFERLCQENGLNFELIYTGENFEYLARLTA